MMRRAALLGLVAATASADPPGRLKGRVFERGSLTPLAGVAVTGATGDTITDDTGRFELELPSGKNEVLIRDDQHESLRATETVKAGEGVEVQYWLRPLPSYKRKYSTTVRGQARREGARFSLSGDELQDVSRAFGGDPFRIVAALGGVATPFPLLPFFVVRGASPGQTNFYLDGMRVPQLFHTLLITATAHPALIDRLEFYAGAYDASFGRVSGGVVWAETRAARPERIHAQAQFRVWDVSAAVETTLPKQIKITASGQFGWPGPLFRLYDPGTDLMYWDYQVRADWKGFTLQFLGSYDRLVVSNELLQAFGAGGAGARLAPELRTTWHRIQLRHRARVARAELETAVHGGIDEASAFSGEGVRKLFLNGRFNARIHLPRLTLFTGLDMELSQFKPEKFDSSVPMSAPDSAGELVTGRNGVVGGAFVQGTVEVVRRRLYATLGGRADVYHANKQTIVTLDPKLLLRAILMKGLFLSAGFGRYTQAPSFPIAVPGIDTYALGLGPQKSWQGEVSVEADLPQSFLFKLTGFYSRLSQVNDVVLDFGASLCTSPPIETLTGLPGQVTRQLNGQAFGMETLLRRREGRVTGWIAYTLSRSERSFQCGLRPADFDQTHVLNTVLQVHLPWNLMATARFYLSSGRPYTRVDPTGLSASANPPRNNERFPTYIQLDLRLDREWLFKRWALDLFVEVLNVTFSEAVLGVTYPDPTGSGFKRYDMPQLLGFNWILPALGVRGRF